ncbi:predicted protein [Sclerotinia sclerotiorum 1980 UF-70]|uniref:Uncharacterized protein n=1 Tax=Sclerotinia sclerotiorum (strain ATCC 18683 / 1980 / Ss-1) TaxID=665079 RepID=A7F5E9_SCLS1|nr:predicted protein [Sclerotinia sclerotiorum 1980 UF-70]EDN97970.1 predicted protein [Sclerotinia sclerotiorum 1980 UF-70]
MGVTLEKERYFDGGAMENRCKDRATRMVLRMLDLSIQDGCMYANVTILEVRSLEAI